MRRLDSVSRQSRHAQATAEYFPPSESQGGWRKLDQPDDIRRLSGMEPQKLADLKAWLLASDDRNFAAVVDQKRLHRSGGGTRK